MLLLFHRFGGLGFESGYLPLDTRSDRLSVALHALVTFHILAVHTSHAVVGTFATRMIMRIRLYMLHEVRIFDQHMRYLEEFKTLVHDLLTVITGLHASNIN